MIKRNFTTSNFTWTKDTFKTWTGTAFISDLPELLGKSDYRGSVGPDPKLVTLVVHGDRESRSFEYLRDEWHSDDGLIYWEYRFDDNCYLRIYND